MKKLIFLTAMAGAVLLAACQAGRQGPQVNAIHAGDGAPVDAPVAFVVSPYGTGIRYNELGGEIPQAAPDGRVEEYRLPEVGSGAAG